MAEIENSDRQEKTIGQMTKFCAIRRSANGRQNEICRDVQGPRNIDVAGTVKTPPPDVHERDWNLLAPVLPARS